MIIDIKQIFIDAFIKLFENVLWLLPIAFFIAIYLFFFRKEIAYDLGLTKRERTKFTEKSFLAIAIISSSTIAYLYIKEYFFLLSIVLSGVLTYFLYRIGLFDLVIEKLDGR